jgi:hypothetical protein
MVGLEDGHLVSKAQKLLIFLHIIAQGRAFSAMQEDFHHARGTISAAFHESLLACLALYDELVVPAKAEDSAAIRAKGSRYWPYFSDCVGALDGSHIAAYIEGDPSKHRNRKMGLSQNVLAAVDFDCKFTYVLAGWEGSAHDTRVLNDAKSRHNFSAPNEKYYLADAGYTNTSITLVPYRGVRYHLREIYEAGLRPENKEELFNLRHSSLRNAVERTFGIFKHRFRIFKTALHFPNLSDQARLVYVCAALHNFLIQRSTSKPTVELEQDPENNYEGSEFGMLLDRMELADTSNSMAQLRETMAEKMWISYNSFRSNIDG